MLLFRMTWLIAACSLMGSKVAATDVGAAHPFPRAATVSQTTLDKTFADVPMLVAVPPRITEHTPVIVMYHGFGFPNTPELLAQTLPPIPNALTIYPSLPLVGRRMPAGGVDELLRRQSNDYIGQLLYPSMLGAAHELPQIISALSKTYGLSKSSPIILFGFSAGGAAALLSLTESNVHPRAVLVVNAPLSIAQAVAAYERQSKNVYVWSENATEASRRYGIERGAEQIAKLNRSTAFLILQSDHDAGLSVADAKSAAAALQTAALRFKPHPDIGAKVLPGSDHHVFEGSESLTTQRTVIDWIEQHAFPARRSSRVTRSGSSDESRAGPASGAASGEALKR